MKFARIGAEGAEIPVVITDDGAYDLSGVVGDFDLAFFDSFFGPGGRGVDAGLEALGAELAALPRVELGDDTRYGSIIRRPGNIICIGQNYAAHARESGAEPPTEPIVFFKPSGTVVGIDDEVPLPPKGDKTDWEVELAVVIGARASYLSSPAEARAHVAGYATSDDVSERYWQMEVSGGQWSKGKSFPRFTPLGPYLVPAGAVDPTALRLRSFVNGEPRQDSATSDMIFSVDEIVYRLSQFMPLEPGDVILTGTPEGVAFSGRFPYLVDGDAVRVEIEGLGGGTQRFVAATATTPTQAEA